MTSPSMALAAPATGTPDISDMLRAGREHYRRGEIRHAIAVFQVGLARAATASIGVAVDCVADLHAALANAFMLCDDIASAGEHYKAALRIAPHLVACWCNLGIVHQRSGKAQDAIALYLEALRRNPGHRPSRTNLVQALVATRQFAIARTLLLELLEEPPEDADLRSQLGKVCFELERDRGGRGRSSGGPWRSIPDRPRVSTGSGRSVRRAASRPRHRPPTPTRRRCIRSCAGSDQIAGGVSGAGAVCALRRQHAGRIPVRGCAYQTSILSLLPGSQPDLALLAARGGCRRQSGLRCRPGRGGCCRSPPRSQRSLGKPVVNDPGKIQHTTRDATALALADVEGCRVPRRSASRPARASRRPAGDLPSFRCWRARPALHGGDDFEKIDDVAALTRVPCGSCRRRPLSDRICRLSLRRRLFPQIPLHLRRRGDPALSSGDRRRLEAASRFHRHGDHAWMQDEEAAFPARTRAGLQCRPMTRRCE